MRSLSFVFLAVYCTLLASAASTYSKRQSYLQQNGPAAEALNNQYASLTADSPCTEGQDACIQGQFGHCYQGRYLTYSCPDNWACAAIPNEWSVGTSTTCDSVSDINWRNQQAGISKRAVETLQTRDIAQLKANGPAAKALNQQYATLTTSSSCNDGDVACVQGQFGHCYQSRYLTYSCPTDWTCQALPNEHSNGTTTTCDYGPDAQWRLTEAGAL